MPGNPPTEIPSARRPCRKGAIGVQTGSRPQFNRPSRIGISFKIQAETLEWGFGEQLSKALLAGLPLPADRLTTAQSGVFAVWQSGQCRVEHLIHGAVPAPQRSARMTHFCSLK